jgi:uncharacterized protein
MMKLTCPTCSKSLQIETMDELPSFPFCSDRCKLIDLGRWIDGAYVIAGRDRGDKPGGPASDDPEEATLRVPEPEEEGAEV